MLFCVIGDVSQTLDAAQQCLLRSPAAILKHIDAEDAGPLCCKHYMCPHEFENVGAAVFHHIGLQLPVQFTEKRAMVVDIGFLSGCSESGCFWASSDWRPVVRREDVAHEARPPLEECRCVQV